MKFFLAAPVGLIKRFFANRHLITQLTWREIVGRYQGSILGIFWSFLNPLFMLGIYTFVFSVVFKARWGGTGEQASTASFAIILFSGLIVHGILGELVSRAPTLIVSNITYVKKVVFPLEILPVVALGAALFHAFVSMFVLLLAQLILSGTIPSLTALWVPVVLAPFLLFLLGISWWLASLGVYLRDINQILAPIITALLFISPVFFPSSSLPAPLRPYLFLNPITLIVNQTREVLIFDRMPNFYALAIYSLVAGVVAVAGLFWFQKTRKGFADVL